MYLVMIGEEKLAIEGGGFDTYSEASFRTLDGALLHAKIVLKDWNKFIPSPLGSLRITGRTIEDIMSVDPKSIPSGFENVLILARLFYTFHSTMNPYRQAIAICKIN